MHHRSLRRALLGASLLALAALPTPAAAQRIDRIVAFGDSLADTGNALHLLLSNPALPPATRTQLQTLYPTGRFSGGTNYIDTLSQLLDAPALNYAVGGARTGTLNQFGPIPGFTQETAIFLSGSTPPGTIFPPNTGFQEGDLLALSIGINDARAFFQANPGGTIAQAQAAAATSVVNATNNLNLLVGAGAPTISYVALNAGLTPDVLASPTLQALGNAYSTTFNTGFQTTLAGYAADGVMVHYLDGPTVLANISANPAAYGISNLFCPTPTPAAPGCLVNASGFLFYADGIHPTSDGMRIIAQYVAAQLQAPLTFAAPSALGLDTARQFGRTLSSRVDVAARHDGAVAEGVKLFLVGDVLQSDLKADDASDAFEVDGVGGTVGATVGLGSGLAGIAVNYTKSKARFDNHSADDRAHSWQVGGFAGMTFGGVFAQGYAGAGWDSHELDRTGVVEDLEASPDGKHWLAGAKAGYLMPMGGFSIGPVVALDYAKAKVDGYTEEGDAALTLDVDSISAKSLTGGIGLELRGDLGEPAMRLRPFASAMVEKELSGNGPAVHFAQTASPTIVNSWRLDDRDSGVYGRLAAGASAQILTGVDLNALIAGTVGRNDGNEVSAHVGVSAGF